MKSTRKVVPRALWLVTIVLLLAPWRSVDAQAQEPAQNPPTTTNNSVEVRQPASQPAAPLTPPTGTAKPPARVGGPQDSGPEKPGDPGIGAPLHFTSQQVFLTISVLALLAGLFCLLLLWQQRTEQSNYLSFLYKDTMKTLEFGRLTIPIEARWEHGEFFEEMWSALSERARSWIAANPKPRPDDSLRDLAASLGEDIDLAAQADQLRWMLIRETGFPGGTPPPGPDPWSYGNSRPGRGGLGFGGDPTAVPGRGTGQSPSAAELEEINRRHDYFKRRAQFRDQQQDWAARTGAEIKRWYQDERSGQEKEAETRAKLALNVDFSTMRGRGPEFVLEFTAVVVIIFAAVVLGILAILKNEQIGTLLAAIAGYVLGRATSRGRTGQGDAAAGTVPPAHEPQSAPGGRGASAVAPNAGAPSPGNLPSGGRAPAAGATAGVT